MPTRRSFLKTTALTSLLSLGGSIHSLASHYKAASSKTKYKYALSQWGVQHAQFGGTRDVWASWMKLLQTDTEAANQGWLKPLDFPEAAKNKFGFNTVELANNCFWNRSQDDKWLAKLRQNAEDHEVKLLLLMIDDSGTIAHPDKAERDSAYSNFTRWIDAAAKLGCDHARVNLQSLGPWDEQVKRTSEALHQLCEYADQYDNLSLVTENHGGMSGNADWLVEVLETTGRKDVGVMVDLDNFFYDLNDLWGGKNHYNRYMGVEKLMPYATTVSAKTLEFDHLGEETKIDFKRMAEIVGKFDFDGYVTAEYEGTQYDEIIGTQKTKELLLKYFG